jgi:hypothetical protein
MEVSLVVNICFEDIKKAEELKHNVEIEKDMRKINEWKESGVLEDDSLILMTNLAMIKNSIFDETAKNIED